MATTRARDFDRWVWLTLRPDGERLFVDYADERGARVYSGEPVAIDSAVAAQGLGAAEPAARALRALSSLFPRVLVGAELKSWLREGFGDRGEWRPHLLPENVADRERPVPWLLPVFVQPPSSTVALPWESWIERLLLDSPDLAERCVIMRGVPLQRPRPAQLPLKLEAVGSASVRWLDAVRKRRWYAQSEAVRQYGLRLIAHDSASYEGGDIVVRRLGKALPGWSIGARGGRPTLVVSIAHDNPWSKRTRAPRLESGMSHLLIMPSSASSGRPGRTAISPADIVTHVVYALVHDFSLHEISWIIRHFVPGVTTWTATDARANRALRLSSVLRDMIDDVRVSRPYLKPKLSWLITDFKYESRGLTAMSNFLALTAGLGPGDLAASAPAPQAGATAVAMPRRADVTVETYDAFGVLAPMDTHERHTALTRGWRYRLRVHIGRPDPDTSAVVGAVPDFDTLLPPPDGTVRAIEVALFAKSFELLSPAVQTILLPLAGDSAPVHFELRAPQSAGLADLRIAFYWNNNLLQSFVLQAEVAEGGAPTAANVPLTVKLASAGVDGFDDLAQLRPRALSVALNDDVAPGSHTVMVKGTGWHEQVQLTGEEMGAKMERFRAILQAAGGAAPDKFDTSIRKLAALGGAIWNMLSIGNRGDVAVLETVRTGTNQGLQFVRHGSGRPFPWQTVYDYTLPQGPAFLTAPICYADTPVQRIPGPGQKGCPHCPDRDVVCIEGFWIVRQRVELLSEDLADGAAAARARRACAPPPNPLVLLGIGTPSLAANKLAHSLKAMLNVDLGDITSSDAPVAQMLWKPERRPAVLVVLSHLLRANEVLNLPDRISAFVSDPESSDASLSVPVMAPLQGLGRWRDPQRPIVLLLACQSARRDVGELTSLIDTFLASGAAAVAGTEWDVMTDVAANFAQHLIEQTLVASPRADLGEAMKRFANASLRNNDISPFIFTMYGNADLTVGRA